MMTSSPGPRSNSMAAHFPWRAVQECVRRAWRHPISRSSHALQRFVKRAIPAQMGRSRSLRASNGLRSRLGDGRLKRDTSVEGGLRTGLS